MSALNGKTRETLNAVGFILRFVLPAAVILIGYLGNDKLLSISESQNELKQEQRAQSKALQGIELDITRLQGMKNDIQRLEELTGDHAVRLRRVEIRNGEPSPTH